MFSFQSLCLRCIRKPEMHEAPAMPVHKSSAEME